ncbi:hypothetical protein EV182_000737 [Spiromyces aspiralis]|uniref:Uncharacterized protein n=1 Tax=Spiromyces aspiralis TaxID=68401 RepID=A0ACC1HHP1_9FUNG|nr:hypothetical protein EV182_000737 [Spiromyces aspiralis]
MLTTFRAIVGIAITLWILAVMMVDALPLDSDGRGQQQQQQGEGNSDQSRFRTACDSPIFCDSPLLKAVQLSGIFKDSKTFVDKPTKRPVTQVLEAFAKLPENPSKETLSRFVNENFGDEFSIIKPANLSDFRPDPNFLGSIASDLLRGFGAEVHSYWGELVRVQDLSGLCDGCDTTMLPIKHKFIVPGGRFREFYYWDSFFILEGLLASELHETAREFLLNFLDMFDHLGFVPNGARIYYLNRSQPPVLSLMISRYYEATNDIAILRRAVPILVKEHAFWVNNRSVTVTDPQRFGDRQFRFFIYNVATDKPRPEGFAPDWQNAHNATSDPAKQRELYMQYASGAESGWDYTVRWAREPWLDDPVVMQTLRVNKIIPPELNSLVYALETTISRLSAATGDSATAAEFAWRARQLRDDMVDFMLDPTTGMFGDWSLEDSAFTGIWSVAAVWPYWQFGETINPAVIQRMLANLAQTIEAHPGGVPSTLITSGLQWDYPAAWPPHQYVVIRGLENINNQVPQRDLPASLVRQVAQNYISSAFCGWYNTGGSIPGLLERRPSIASNNDTGHMFEKYDAGSIGRSAGGGEYAVQDGFGWTNGVVLWVLDKFGDILTNPTCSSPST